MTGGTLGTADGFLLGTSDGATLGTGADQWQIDGAVIGTVRSEVATFDSLTLDIRATTEQLERALRPAKTDENQMSVLATDDGGFTSVDRTDGGNTFTVTPPVRRQPLRFEDDYRVARYEEDLVSQDLGEWDVELELIPSANRTDDNPLALKDQRGTQVGGDAGGTLGQASGFTLGGATGATIGNQTTGLPGDFWEFDTNSGPIATDRVDAEFLGTGADGVERFEVTTRLTFRQALTFESVVSRLNAVRVREIPDATNRGVDDTNDDTNTVTIDAPDDQDVVADGTYVVTEWKSQRLNDAFQTYDIVIAREG